MKIKTKLISMLKNNFLFKYIREKLKIFVIRIIGESLQDYALKTSLETETINLHSILSVKVNKQIDGSLIPENFAFGVGSNIIIPKDCILEMGKNTYIGRYVELGPFRKISIGDYTSIQDRCILLGNISIGRYCTLANNIYISSGRHFYSYNPFLNIKDQDKLLQEDLAFASEFDRPVQIEDDVWIGINVVIMSGITIGKGSVIGSNSVVTKNVPPYSVMVGSPAKLLKKRLEFFPPNEIIWNREADFPYFYSGFLMSMKEKEEYNTLLGLAVLNEFSVSLFSENYNFICIIIKKNIEDQVFLTFGLEVKEIKDVFQEIFFSVLERKSVFVFTISSDSVNLVNCIILSCRLISLK
jgi:acetyltransferase-like isoleucine patch superfamily enzyme